MLGHIEGLGHLVLADVVTWSDGESVIHWREPHVTRPHHETPAQLEQRFSMPSCHLVWDDPLP